MSREQVASAAGRPEARLFAPRENRKQTVRRVVSWLTEYSYRKALLVLVAVALVIGFGAYTITRVREELLPDISFPVITVIARSPGDQPQDITDNVITPVESAVSGLPGVQKTSSTAVSGLGVTMLSYNYGTDLNSAETAVKQALADAHLGSNVSTSILKFDISMIPIVTFSLEGNLSQADLYQLAQSQVVPNLTDLDGVASVSVSGGALNQVVVTLDCQKPLDSGLTYDEVTQALQANNVILPSGGLATGDTVLPLETVAVYKSLDDIRNIGIRTTSPAGAPASVVPLGDIATVAEALAAPNGASRTDGQPAVSIQVTKAKDANTVQVARSVTGELDKIKPSLPQGASFSVFFDQSTFVDPFNQRSRPGRTHRRLVCNHHRLLLPGQLAHDCGDGCLNPAVRAHGRGAARPLGLLVEHHDAGRPHHRHRPRHRRLHRCPREHLPAIWQKGRRRSRQSSPAPAR